MTHNDELVKVQLDKELYNELIEAVAYYRDECNQQSNETEYLRDFISWMHLDDLYINFRHNAKRTYEGEDDPFGRYTL